MPWPQIHLKKWMNEWKKKYRNKHKKAVRAEIIRGDSLWMLKGTDEQFLTACITFLTYNQSLACESYPQNYTAITTDQTVGSTTDRSHVWPVKMVTEAIVLLSGQKRPHS